MSERIRAAALPLALVATLTVIVVGLLTAPPREADRTESLAARLRCPVCQGESVADSPSDTALAIRDQIEGFVAAGRSDAWVLDHYVDRYGRWVLLDPPASGDTLLLWLLPIAAAGLGLIAVARRRRRAAPPSVDDLSADERATLDAAVARLRNQEGAL